MCVVSMVMEYYTDKWNTTTHGYFNIPLMPTQAEIDEFRKLLERARKYDKDNGEPDCELAEKKAALKKIADQLGIDISFVDKETP